MKDKLGASWKAEPGGPQKPLSGAGGDDDESSLKVRPRLKTHRILLILVFLTSSVTRLISDG